MNDGRHQGFAVSGRRVRLIARHALGEALHLKLTALLGLTGAVLVAGAGGLRVFNFGAAELKFIADFGLGVVGLFGTFFAVLATTQLFFGDIENGSIGATLSRPVRRGEYLLGRFAGTAGVLAIFTASLVLVLGIVIAMREGQLRTAFVPLPVFLQAGALVWLKLTLVAAMTLLVCAYAGSPLFASGAGLLLALVGQLRPLAEVGGSLAWLRAWPDLGLFDTDVLLAAGHAPSGFWLPGLALYWAAYVLLCIALAAYVFKHREF